MRVVNLLEFINKSKDLYSLDFVRCNNDLVNFLDLMLEDEQFTRSIDLGLIYIAEKTIDKYIIVDGLNRILSLSLLLHAVCECYKQTSAKNDNAIKTIRNKYLVHGAKTKLNLNLEDQTIFNKIIFGEKMSGKEKNTPMFNLLHNFWTQIKTEELHASDILTMLNKIQVTIVDVEDISQRELYLNLNKDRRDIEQLLLIENYLNEKSLGHLWLELCEKYDNRADDIELFFKDFFTTKFNFKKFNEQRLYENFRNYFETIEQYQSSVDVMSAILKSAKLYNDILNVNMPTNEIKNAFIQIKMNNGEDTYAYLLSIYEDYVDNNISDATFNEILLTIADYLKNRLETPSNVSFNELIHYLNAFLTCK